MNDTRKHNIKMLKANKFEYCNFKKLSKNLLSSRQLIGAVILDFGYVKNECQMNRIL